jgi:tetratricopeptide (TPR) repeat protein
MAERKFDQAVVEYEKVIKKDPQSTGTHMLLGILYDLKQDHKKANDYYKKVLDINKNFAPAANNLAWNYMEHGGDLDVAVSLAQKAREILPDDPHVADTLGWIYYKKGVYATAIGILKESSEKFQNRNATVLYHLGMAHYRQGNPDAAGDTLKLALKISKDFPGAEEAKKVLTNLQAQARKQ